MFLLLFFVGFYKINWTIFLNVKESNRHPNNVEFEPLTLKTVNSTQLNSTSSQFLDRVNKHDNFLNIRILLFSRRECELCATQMRIKQVRMDTAKFVCKKSCRIYWQKLQSLFAKIAKFICKIRRVYWQSCRMYWYKL